MWAPCVMTWPLGAVKRWDIFVKTGSLKGELRSTVASATQNCLENTTARILKYRTNVNGTVKYNGFSVSILKQSEGFLYVTFNGT